MNNTLEIKDNITKQYVNGSFPSSSLIKRDIYKDVMEYLCSTDYTDKICAVFGLRRTGKTTIMEQCADSLSPEQRGKAVFFTCLTNSIFLDLLKQVGEEIEKGYKYIFIDEVTYANGFQNMGAVLSDNYVKQHGVRIVVCGTHSLGISLASQDLMYDRIKFVNTTYTTFPEYAKLTGINDLDYYIKLGSTLKTDVFINRESCIQYIETSIVKNILDSLEKSEGIRRYPAALTELYENDELASFIQKRINSYSQDVTIKSLRKVFHSAPLSTTVKNFTQPNRYEIIDFSQYFDLGQANVLIADKLGIKDNPSVQLKDNHLRALNDYLNEIGVFLQIPVYESLTENLQANDMHLMIHAGMAHANIVYALEVIGNSRLWKEDTPKEIKERLKAEVENVALGYLLEDTITSNVYTMLTNNPQKIPHNYSFESKWFVSKLHIRGKEIDTLVFDRENKEVYLFEVKHSKENVPNQSKNLEDPDFLNYIEHHFGTIKARAVLYSGITDDSSIVPRISASMFLQELYKEKDQKDFSMENFMNKLSPKNIGFPQKNDNPNRNTVDIEANDYEEDKSDDDYDLGK